MECSICLEEDPDYKLSICGHTFHESCINKWIAIKPLCPLCRALCVNKLPFMYKNSMFKMGTVTVLKNELIIKYSSIFKYLCKPSYKTIPFGNIKKIEYNREFFKIIYIKNYRPSVKIMYTRNAKLLFEICKFQIFQYK